jgi:mono/diheme cytochrome c family protein
VKFMRSAVLRIAPLAMMLAVASGLATQAASDEKPAGDVKHGSALFGEHCALCHGAKAEGGMGPSLKDESKRKTRDQIRMQVMRPEPPMAKLYPGVLSEKDVDDVVAFVATL